MAQQSKEQIMRHFVRHRFPADRTKIRKNPRILESWLCQKKAINSIRNSMMSHKIRNVSDLLFVWSRTHLYRKNSTTVGSLRAGKNINIVSQNSPNNLNFVRKTTHPSLYRRELTQQYKLCTTEKLPKFKFTRKTTFWTCLAFVLRWK